MLNSALCFVTNSEKEKQHLKIFSSKNSDEIYTYFNSLISLILKKSKIYLKLKHLCGQQRGSFDFSKDITRRNI